MPLMSDIEPFLPGTVPFSQHLEQLDWIFSHHKVTDSEEKKITFLASCNTEVFSELKLLFPDRNLKHVPYSEICNALCRRYDKSESILRRRYKFYRREQGPSESAEDFIRAVKQLAERCEFGSFKNMAIRDRLVCGIMDRDLQKRLLEKGDPTLYEIEQLILDEDILGSRREERKPTRTEERYRHQGHQGSKDHIHAHACGGDRSVSREQSRRSRSRSRSPLPRLEPAVPGRKAMLRCTFCGRDGHTVRYCFDKKNKEKAQRWESKRAYPNNGKDPLY